MAVNRGIIAGSIKGESFSVPIMISPTSDPVQASACLLLASDTKYVASADFPATVNSVIYNEPELLTLFVGGNEFWKQGVGTIQVNNSGLITAAQSCP